MKKSDGVYCDVSNIVNNGALVDDFLTLQENIHAHAKEFQMGNDIWLKEQLSKVDDPENYHVETKTISKQDNEKVTVTLQYFLKRNEE